jgi:CheY-like chemotaxis protein
MTRPVLLVEDDVETRDALRDILADHGLLVFTAMDGESALSVLGKLCSPPAAIIIDVVLPGMSGHDLRWALLQRPGLARVPVIAMSGTRDAHMPHATFFQKPFDVAHFVDTIASMVVANA